MYNFLAEAFRVNALRVSLEVLFVRLSNHRYAVFSTGDYPGTGLGRMSGDHRASFRSSRRDRAARQAGHKPGRAHSHQDWERLGDANYERRGDARVGQPGRMPS